MNTSRYYFIDIGVVGDYTSTRIFVRNTPSGIVTGIQDENGNYITDDPIMTLNATNDLYVQIVLAWSTSIFYADVISDNDSVRIASAQR